MPKYLGELSRSTTTSFHISPSPHTQVVLTSPALCTFIRAHILSLVLLNIFFEGWKSLKSLLWLVVSDGWCASSLDFMLHRLFRCSTLSCKALPQFVKSNKHITLHYLHQNPLLLVCVGVSCQPQCLVWVYKRDMPSVVHKSRKVWKKGSKISWLCYSHNIYGSVTQDIPTFLFPIHVKVVARLVML